MWDFILGLVIGLGVGGFSGILVMALAVNAARLNKEAARLDGEFLADLGTDD